MHAITYVLKCPKTSPLVDMASVMAARLPGEILPAVEVPYVDASEILLQPVCVWNFQTE
jgi:hypothetical protein